MGGRCATITGDDAVWDHRLRDLARKPDYFATKYQVSFDVNKGYAAEEVRINLPYYLYDYRTTHYMWEPEDWDGDVYRRPQGPSPSLGILRNDLSGTGRDARILTDHPDHCYDPIIQ